MAEIVPVCRRVLPLGHCFRRWCDEDKCEDLLSDVYLRNDAWGEYHEARRWHENPSYPWYAAHAHIRWPPKDRHGDDGGMGEFIKTLSHEFFHHLLLILEGEDAEAFHPIADVVWL